MLLPILPLLMLMHNTATHHNALFDLPDVRLCHCTASVIPQPSLAMKNHMSTNITSGWPLILGPECHVLSVARVHATSYVKLHYLITFAGPGLVIYTHAVGVGYSGLHVLQLALLNELHQLGLFSPHGLASLQGASLLVRCGLSKTTPSTRARPRNAFDGVCDSQQCHLPCLHAPQALLLAIKLHASVGIKWHAGFVLVNGSQRSPPCARIGRGFSHGMQGFVHIVQGLMRKGSLEWRIHDFCSALQAVALIMAVPAAHLGELEQQQNSISGMSSISYLYTCDSMQGAAGIDVTSIGLHVHPREHLFLLSYQGLDQVVHIRLTRQRVLMIDRYGKSMHLFQPP
jgi:hypothetical protein